MGTFEHACAATERAAASAVVAVTAELKAAKELATAARDGDIARLRKAVDKLRAASDAARQEISNAQRAWPFSADEEEELLKTSYADELREAAREQGIDLRPHEQRLLAFPTIVRILPGQRAVQLDRKAVKTLRPSRIVALLKAAAAKKPKTTSERFIETLHDAYVLVGGTDDGQGVTLARVYEALTLMPDVRREYGAADFSRDLFLLDQSGVRQTKSGARLSLPAATGTKGTTQVFQFVSPTGEPVSYYGIKFVA